MRRRHRRPLAASTIVALLRTKLGDHLVAFALP
jgi:hypothetical protein